MNFVTYITVPGNTTASAPVVTRIIVPKGYLMGYDIRLISGTEAATDLRVFHGSNQVIPCNPDGVIKPMAIFTGTHGCLPILEPPYEFTITATNSNSGTNVVCVLVTMLPPDDLDVLSGFKSAISPRQG